MWSVRLFLQEWTFGSTSIQKLVYHISTITMLLRLKLRMSWKAPARIVPREGARIALGQTAAGRYLKVVYVPDSDPNSVFVITAFELNGRPLQAYKRRRKRKPS